MSTDIVGGPLLGFDQQIADAYSNKDKKKDIDRQLLHNIY